MPYLIANMDDIAIPLDVVEDGLRQRLAGAADVIKWEVYVPSFPDVRDGLRIEALALPRYAEGISGLRIVSWQMASHIPVRYRFLERVGENVIRRGEVGQDQDPLEAAYGQFVQEQYRELSVWLRNPLVGAILRDPQVVVALPLFRRLMVSWFTDAEKPRLAPGIALPLGPALDALAARVFAVPFSCATAYGGRIAMRSEPSGYRIVTYGERREIEHEEIHAEPAVARMALLHRLLLG